MPNISKMIAQTERLRQEKFIANQIEYVCNKFNIDYVDKLSLDEVNELLPTISIDVFYSSDATKLWKIGSSPTNTQLWKQFRNLKEIYPHKIAAVIFNADAPGVWCLYDYQDSSVFDDLTIINTKEGITYCLQKKTKFLTNIFKEI